MWHRINQAALPSDFKKYSLVFIAILLTRHRIAPGVI
jgi:hypothetical protein